MIITRSEPPETNFRCFKNSLIRDLKLSHRARGILLILLSNASGFQIVADDLQTEKEGREAVRTAIRELIAAGFIRRERKQNEKGHWITETYVYDSPKPTEDGFPGVGYPEVGLPEVGFSGAIKKTSKNTNNKNNSPAPQARNTPEPPALGANPPATAGESFDFFENHPLWPDLIEQVNESSRGYFCRELSNLKLRGGGTLIAKHADAVINYLISKGPPLNLLKGIIKRGGWDARKLSDAARPGESVEQAINRLGNEREHHCDASARPAVQQTPVRQSVAPNIDRAKGRDKMDEISKILKGGVKKNPLDHAGSSGF